MLDSPAIGVAGNNRVPALSDLRAARRLISSDNQVPRPDQFGDECWSARMSAGCRVAFAAASLELASSMRMAAARSCWMLRCLMAAARPRQGVSMPHGCCLCDVCCVGASGRSQFGARRVCEQCIEDQGPNDDDGPEVAVVCCRYGAAGDAPKDGVPQRWLGSQQSGYEWCKDSDSDLILDSGCPAFCRHQILVKSGGMLTRMVTDR
jgi:hypothetical protein